MVVSRSRRVALAGSNLARARARGHLRPAPLAARARPARVGGAAPDRRRPLPRRAPRAPSPPQRAACGGGRLVGLCLGYGVRAGLAAAATAIVASRAPWTRRAPALAACLALLAAAQRSPWEAGRRLPPGAQPRGDRSVDRVAPAHGVARGVANRRLRRGRAAPFTAPVGRWLAASGGLDAAWTGTTLAKLGRTLSLSADPGTTLRLVLSTLRAVRALHRVAPPDPRGRSRGAHPALVRAELPRPPSRRGPGRPVARGRRRGGRRRDLPRERLARARRLPRDRLLPRPPRARRRRDARRRGQRSGSGHPDREAAVPTTELLARWLFAFAFTQAVECPIYVCVFRVRLAVAFGASTITHPLRVLRLPLAVAEPLPRRRHGAPLVGALAGRLFRRLRRPRPRPSRCSSRPPSSPGSAGSAGAAGSSRRSWPTRRAASAASSAPTSPAGPDRPMK